MFSKLGRRPGSGDGAGGTEDGVLPKGPTQRQSSLLTDLLGKFSAKQREAKRQKELVLEGHFLEFYDATVSQSEMGASGDGSELRGQVTVMQFQELLVTKLQLPLDSRQVFELFNEWEDACDNIEGSTGVKADSGNATGRARVFAALLVQRGLFKDPI